MGGIFGKKKQPSRVTEHDKAVLQLKQVRDKIRQYQRRIGAQLERDRQVAKELVKDGKKDKAKLLLRKKRFQESLLEKTDGQIENIERMVQDLEYSQIESQVVAGLKSGNEALNKMHQLLSLEDVERIMSDTQEGVEYQQEIDELLAGGLTQEDEADVLSELDDILQENQVEFGDENLQLPDVPTDKIKETQPSREKERVMLAS